MVAKTYTITGTISGLASCVGTEVKMVKDSFTSADAVLSTCDYTISWTYASYLVPTTATSV